MPNLPPDPAHVLAALRAVLTDVRSLLEPDPHDERLLSTFHELRRAEQKLESYAGQARPRR